MATTAPPRDNTVEREAERGMNDPYEHFGYHNTRIHSLPREEVEAVQLAAVAALTGPTKPLEEMNKIYSRRRDLVVATLRDIGVDVESPKGTIYVWAPVPKGHTST